MNKTELTDQIAEITGMTKKTAKKAVDLTLLNVSSALAAEEKVVLTGFGTFEVRESKARKGRHPQTGEEIDIPAGKTVKFRPGKRLRSAVDNGAN